MINVKIIGVVNDKEPRMTNFGKRNPSTRMSNPIDAKESYAPDSAVH